MGKPTAPTKDRIRDASAELFRRQGYTGTGVKQIVAEASAPLGSLYHFFPGGKEELGEEVIRWSGAMYGLLAVEILDPAPDLVTGVHNFFAGAAETLVETDYADACPIATIALEVSSTNELLRRACHDVFELWLDGLQERFVAAGVPKKQARSLAISFIALLEGAFVLSRAAHDTEPLAAAGAAAVELVRVALPAKRPVKAAKRGGRGKT